MTEVITGLVMVVTISVQMMKERLGFKRMKFVSIRVGVIYLREKHVAKYMTIISIYLGVHQSLISVNVWSGT